MAEKSKRMQPIVRVADQRERQAAQALGDARGVAAQQESRLTDLRNYRQEYVNRFEALGRTGITGAQIREYQRFLDQLDRAISQQEQTLIKAQQAVDGSKQEWVNKNTKATAIRNVVDRFQKAEAYSAARSEQKDTDNRRPPQSGLHSETG